MISADKKELRSMMRRREAEWRAQDASAAEREDAFVWSKVESMASFAEADTILLYMSIPGEVATGEFLSRWYGRKRIVLPVVVGESLVLREYDPALMVPGFRGIMEPSARAAEVPASDVDFVAVPGVAFTSNGHRLGRGGGFYDRLLPSLRPDCVTVGVGYSFRLVDSLPLEPWDAPLSAVVVGRL